MNMYCLFCNSVKRAQVAELIRLHMDVEVLIPRILRRKWIKGKAFDNVQEYLPGYLFLYSDTPIETFRPLFRQEDVYRVLGNRDDGYRLSGNDLAFAQMLRNVGGTIGVLKTYKEGDRVKLTKSAMGGVEGEIIKLDHRGRALVRFGFDGAAIQSWVTIEQVAEDDEICLPQE